VLSSVFEEDANEEWPTVRSRASQSTDCTAILGVVARGGENRKCLPIWYNYATTSHLSAKSNDYDGQAWYRGSDVLLCFGQ